MIDFLFNLSEASLHIIFINFFILFYNKKTSIIITNISIFFLASIFQVMTNFNIEFTVYHCLVVIVFLFFYSYIRNKKKNKIKCLAFSLLSTALISFSLTISILFCQYLFDISTFNILSHISINISVMVVLISRLLYFILGCVIFWFYKTHLQNIVITQKHMLIGITAIFGYSVSYEILLNIFLKYNKNTETVFILFLVIGIMMSFFSVFFYFVLKSNKLRAMIELQQQKEQYDTKDIISFYQQALELNRLRDEIITLLIPFVETLNAFEYGEARQFLYEFYTRMDFSSGANYKLDDNVDVVIAMKTEECKKKGIIIDTHIKSNVKIKSVFNTFELVTILSTMFDIAIQECEKSNSSLDFIYNTQQTAIFLMMTYKLSDDETSLQKVESIFNLILEKELKDVGGYSIYSKKDNTMCHTVMIPYVGKSYYLKGSSRTK